MASSDTMGPSPSKKRRIAPGPKDRTTEYLDLTKPDCDFDAMDQARRDRLVDALRGKKKIVVIAGAGISVSADIPDFRSSQGLFAPAGRQTQKLKASGKHLFDAAVYKRDALTEEFHTMVREMAALAEKAEPTPFHNLLASLAQEGRLLRLYSQNIDCIDTSMKPLATNVPLNPKGPWPATIQLHGGLEKMVCIKCGNLQQLQPGLFEGPEAPLCKSCIEDDEIRTSFAGKRSHGIGRLRPRFVLYNEYNPDEEAIGNVCRADLKARPDAVIVVGTSLKVPGTRRLVKELCQVTRSRRGGFTAWINLESEPKGAEFKDCWDMVVKSRCDVVAREVDLPPWDCAIGDDYHVSPEKASEIRRRWSTNGTSPHFEVQFPTKPKQGEEEQAKEVQAKAEPVKDEQGIPTPKPSPKISPVGKSKKTRDPKPAKKSKQTKLSFGDQKTSESKVTKPAKKAGTGKRGRPLKATQPKSTVLDSFKSGKNVQHDDLLKKEVDSGKSSDTIENIQPQRTALPSLRPDQPKIISSPMYKASSTDVAEIPPNGDTDSSRPLTPAKVEKPYVRETISPTSCPKDLRMLID
jgi:NAD+-dependent protein deacetylase SIR2